MPLENKLNITDAVELARVEEKLSKAKAHKLFTSGFLDTLDAGTYQALADYTPLPVWRHLRIAGKLRTVNIAKGNFRFAPVMYLKVALDNIETMPQSTFDEIVEKYVEMGRVSN